MWALYTGELEPDALHARTCCNQSAEAMTSSLWAIATALCILLSGMLDRMHGYIFLNVLKICLHVQPLLVMHKCQAMLT